MNVHICTRSVQVKINDTPSGQEVTVNPASCPVRVFALEALCVWSIRWLLEDQACNHTDRWMGSGWGSFTFAKQPFNQWNRLSYLSMCPLLRIRVYNIWDFTLLVWKCGSLLEKLMSSCFLTAKFSNRKGKNMLSFSDSACLRWWNLTKTGHISVKKKEESKVLDIKVIKMFTKAT